MLNTTTNHNSIVILGTHNYLKITFMMLMMMIPMMTMTIMIQEPVSVHLLLGLKCQPGRLKSGEISIILIFMIILLKSGEFTSRFWWFWLWFWWWVYVKILIILQNNYLNTKTKPIQWDSKKNLPTSPMGHIVHPLWERSSKYSRNGLWDCSTIVEVEAQRIWGKSWRVPIRVFGNTFQVKEFMHKLFCLESLGTYFYPLHRYSNIDQKHLDIWTSIYFYLLYFGPK